MQLIYHFELGAAHLSESFSINESILGFLSVLKQSNKTNIISRVNYLSVLLKSLYQICLILSHSSVLQGCCETVSIRRSKITVIM